MGTAQGLIEVAYSYLGTTEDDPRFAELIEYYNEHTDGYDMTLDDEWCACFASDCSLKSGNEDATGTSVNCAEFRRIWREKGICRNRWETPEPGWLIDYDWNGDDIPDHIGIVVGCDGETIHVIEGNANEVCAERWVPVGSGTINCFAAPDYQGEIEEEEMYPVNVPEKGAAVYRLYNGTDHFYTTDEHERDLAVSDYGYALERIEWHCPEAKVAVFRMYNGADHFYTDDFDEAQNAARNGYWPESVGFFTDRDGKPVFRLYNGEDHFYTTSESERDNAVENGGYAYERVAFHV